MFFHWLFFFWTFILDIATICHIASDEKDLEILLLRQQLRIVERKQQRGPARPRWQKVPFVAVAVHIRERGSNAKAKLTANLLLFKPETVLRWHRELVRRKWRFRQTNLGGRPRTNPETESLVLLWGQKVNAC
jgi:putative transposase